MGATAMPRDSRGRYTARRRPSRAGRPGRIPMRTTGEGTATDGVTIGETITLGAEPTPPKSTTSKSTSTSSSA